MRLSIIIPAWRDNQALSRLLDNLHPLEPGAVEIIVVDGSADAHCEQLCRQFQARWLTADACRGLQLDTGARAAAGDVLWFLHADSTVHPSAVRDIHACLASGAVGGYFRFRFSGKRSWRLRLFEMLTNWRTRIAIPYGDQGLFMTADAYRQCGGFAHQPLFEEVRLVQRLRRMGTFKLLPQALATSPRRWQRDGWWRRSLLNRGLALAHGLGVSPERLHRWYVRCQRPAGDSEQRRTVKASSGS